MPKYKIKETDDIKVIVEPFTGTYWDRVDLEKRIKYGLDVCDDIVKDINKHVDSVRDIEINQEKLYEYTFYDEDGAKIECEEKSLIELCKEMAWQKGLLRNYWKVKWYMNNEKYSSDYANLSELLDCLASRDVYRIEGKLNDYQRILIDQAIELNDNELHIEFVE